MMTTQIFFPVFLGSQRVFFLDNNRRSHGSKKWRWKIPRKKVTPKGFPCILMYGVFEVLKCLVRVVGDCLNMLNFIFKKVIPREYEIV